MKQYKTMKRVNAKKIFSQRGRHPQECWCGCGQSLDIDGDIIQIHANGFGSGCIYAHEPCVMPTLYGDEERENIAGTPNVTIEKKPRTSVEVEMFNDIINRAGGQRERQHKAMDILCSGDYPELTDLYVSILLFGCKHSDSPLQDIGLDSSTALEGHFSEVSIEASSKVFHNLTSTQVEILANDNNGHHIHCDTINASYEIKKTCFEYVLKAIQLMPLWERLDKFGSDFRFFATTEVGKKHTYRNRRTGEEIHHYPWDNPNEWDAIYPAICLHSHTTEFRLSRFKNADQMINCMKWWRGTVQLFNDNYLLVENGSKSIEWLGRRLARELKYWDTKYTKGR